MSAIASGYTHGSFDHGLGSLTGTVDRLGVPGAYVVAAMDKVSLRCVAVGVSEANGNYLLSGVRHLGNYFLLAQDRGAEPVNWAISSQVTMGILDV